MFICLFVVPSVFDAVSTRQVFLGLLCFTCVVSFFTCEFIQLRGASDDSHVSQLGRFLKQREVPLHLSSRIRRYVEYKLNEQKRAIPIGTVRVLQLLPKQMQDELGLALNASHLLIHPLLEAMNSDMALVLQRLCSSAVLSNHLAPNEVLLMPCETATHMHFVAHGKFSYARVLWANRCEEFVGEDQGWITEAALWTSEWKHLGHGVFGETSRITVTTNTITTNINNDHNNNEYNNNNHWNNNNNNNNKNKQPWATTTKRQQQTAIESTRTQPQKSLEQQTTTGTTTKQQQTRILTPFTVIVRCCHRLLIRTNSTNNSNVVAIIIVIVVVCVIVILIVIVIDTTNNTNTNTNNNNNNKTITNNTKNTNDKNNDKRQRLLITVVVAVCSWCYCHYCCYCCYC